MMGIRRVFNEWFDILSKFNRDHLSQETDGMSSRASDSGAESSGSESPPPAAAGPATRSPPSPSPLTSSSAAAASAATASPGIFRLTSSNAELVYSNLAAMVNSSGASGPQQQAAVLFRLGQLGRQLQASGQQPFILPMPNPPAAHQTPADLSSKSSRNKSEL